MIVAPIHTGPVGESTVRFFKAPGDVPALPWHAVDDLFRSIDLSRHHRRHLLQTAPRADVRTLATPDGLVVIGSHPMAQGFIQAAVECGAPREVELNYQREAAAALKKLAGDRPLIESVRFAVEAFRNTNDGGDAA